MKERCYLKYKYTYKSSEKLINNRKITLFLKLLIYIPSYASNIRTV